MLGATQLESCFAEEGLGILVDTKLKMSQECALATQKARGTRGCIGKRAVGRLRGLILPLYSAVVKPHLGCCVHFWAPQYRRDTDILERVRQKQ